VQAAQASGVSVDRIRAVALDFVRNGRSLAVGPGVQSTHRAATAVASAVAILNSVAGNLGRTVRLSEQEAPGGPVASYRDLQNLINRMRTGHVTALLVHGPNPLYTMPESAAVREALDKAAFVASFSPFLDETAERAHLLLPDHHALESWGDYTPRTGVRALLQPVMTPVFATRQTADVLLSVARSANASIPNVVPNAQADQPPTYYDYLRGAWQRDVFPQAGGTSSFDQWWHDTLKVGVVIAPATAPAASATLNSAQLSQVAIEAATFEGTGEFHLVVYPSMRLWDGRHANKAWMQELPDPVSKFTWVSWLELNPAVAQRLGLDTGHIVRVRTTTGEAELPVWIHPGIREDVIAIQMGEGHTALGRYARNRGVNPIALLRPDVDPLSGSLVWFQARADVEPTGRWVRPPQHSINDDQEDREIAQTISLNDARARDIERGLIPGERPTQPAHEPPGQQPEGEAHGAVHPHDAVVRQLQSHGGMLPSTVNASPAGFPHVGMFWGEYTEASPRWGMAIDLDRCTGCSACITACYAENNIAIVGPDQVAMGRIMHWIRIERYFEREDGELKRTRILPMICQHCSNAPCEPVCPVFAAYHTPDGLNAQVYNRCVGTRYCSNNCPYKVRVFNWFTAEWPEPLNWQLNPDVTVREKGVMEKCTFCVQRIREAQNHARLEDRAVQDGEIVPACAQTCPGDAIVFGNVADPNARVSRIAASGRGYRVLEPLNTQSAVVYLKQVSLEAEA
jgi:molybdopterin-containing oxidoreductase family iron-sulfur binding subunit